jgi:hypothetical protein
MRRHLSLMTIAILGTVLVAGVWAQPPWAQGQGKQVQSFQGYWMGIDPVDGGDARRSFVQLENGRFALAARDTVFTLCDGTEHGFGSFDDGVVVGRKVLQSDSLILKCLNVPASVTLRVRYELITDSLMNEVATLQDGTPVSTIVLHRVSGE